MKRKKPLGWPAYMTDKALKSGVAYYWSPPTWAKKAGCPMTAEALGMDYGTAKARCDDILNPAFEDWRLRGQGGAVPRGPQYGTGDWLIVEFRRLRAQKGRKQISAKHMRQTDRYLENIADMIVRDGRRVGALPVSGFTPGFADKLLDKALAGDGEKARTARAYAMAWSRCWTMVQRAHPTALPAINPFAKMEIGYRAKRTRPVTFASVMAFVKAADEAGAPSIGSAAMISYFWMLRETDILQRFAWPAYRPADNPNIVRAFHHKTGEEIAIPLFDDDGKALWPELMDRLDGASRRGSLVVMMDNPHRRTGVVMPWNETTFRHRVAKIREAAGLPAELKFMGIRHGSMTDAADSGLTDAQFRALSGHRSENVVLRYAQATGVQSIEAARKLRETRTKKG